MFFTEDVDLWEDLTHFIGWISLLFILIFTYLLQTIRFCNTLDKPLIYNLIIAFHDQYWSLLSKNTKTQVYGT